MGVNMSLDVEGARGKGIETDWVSRLTRWKGFIVNLTVARLFSFWASAFILREFSLLDMYNSFFLLDMHNS